MTQLVCHGEVQLCKCGAILEEVPTADSTRSRYAFDITHRKDGTPIKNLDTRGPFLGVTELGWCNICNDYFLIIDSEDDPEVWRKLPKLHPVQ